MAGNEIPADALSWLRRSLSSKSPLSSTWFIVVFSNGQWWVDHEGKPYGPYASADEASEGAVRLARFISEDSKWEVFAPGADGRHVLVSARSDDIALQPVELDAEESH